MVLEMSCSTRLRDGQSDRSDRCGWWKTSARIVMAVADGRGLGPQAAYAADIAMACIGAGLERPFDEMFSACDARLRDTHGVALAVALIDIEKECLTLASVGNVRAVLLKQDGEYRLGSTQGILGAGHYRLTTQTRMLHPGDVLALFSDGADDSSALREALKRLAPPSRDQVCIVLDRWAHADDDAAALIYRHRNDYDR
jgi:serine/threonine protein phosphatase PrpC